MVKVENNTDFNRVINGVMIHRGVNDVSEKDMAKLSAAMNDQLVKALAGNGKIVMDVTPQQTSDLAAATKAAVTSAQLPDVANMNVADAVNAINTISDKNALEALLKSETTSANRKGVIDAINARLK